MGDTADPGGTHSTRERVLRPSLDNALLQDDLKLRIKRPPWHCPTGILSGIFRPVCCMCARGLPLTGQLCWLISMSGSQS
mmetsp:Transcript_147/g.566  ORF Transcript_147/g.566 Transcript_147/m.566 type:complete len:80 (+) Transcript_147:1551-1790(+)